MNQTNGINGSQNFSRQSGVPSFDVLFKLRHRSHTDDGAGHSPTLVAKSKRHLGGRHAVVAGKLVVEFGCCQ